MAVAEILTSIIISNDKENTLPSKNKSLSTRLKIELPVEIGNENFVCS